MSLRGILVEFLLEKRVNRSDERGFGAVTAADFNFLLPEFKFYIFHFTIIFNIPISSLY